MSEDHIIKIRNGCTLAEMTQMSLPASRIDPIIKQLMPNFHIFSNKKLNPSKKQTPSKENQKIFEPKSLPLNHYIEERFYPYSKAKITNKPLFSDISYKSTVKPEQSTARSDSASKFHTSRYPNVPLSKELSSRVENVNSFREIDKKGLKKMMTNRPSSNLSISRKSFRSNKILLNLKSWDKIKKEKSGNGKVESENGCGKSSELSDSNCALMVKRPKSENNYRNVLNKNRKVELVNTMESGSSVLSPMAPVYAMSKMVPQSPNLVIYPYARYGHLFE